MYSATRKKIDWDSILETYGPDTKMALHKLLTDHEIPESDPAAMIIAALFMTQIDSNRSFNSISKTIDSGKNELSAQFSEQILKLKGIVTYAEEHIIETSQQAMDERRTEMYDVIKQGVAKAIWNRQSTASRRDMVNTIATIVCVTVASAVSVLVGATGTYVMVSRKDNPHEISEIETLSNADVWVGIAKTNQAQLSLCLNNLDQLDRKCAVTIPD